jgi:hypothetical protein
MKELLIIFVVLLVLLMLISTFGGSIVQTEQFYVDVPTTVSSVQVAQDKMKGVVYGAQQEEPTYAQMQANIESYVASQSSEKNDEHNELKIEPYDNMQSFAAY